MSFRFPYRLARLLGSRSVAWHYFFRADLCMFGAVHCASNYCKGPLQCRCVRLCACCAHSNARTGTGTEVGNVRNREECPFFRGSVPSILLVTLEHHSVSTGQPQLTYRITGSVHLDQSVLDHIIPIQRGRSDCQLPKCRGGSLSGALFPSIAMRRSQVGFRIPKFWEFESSQEVFPLGGPPTVPYTCRSIYVIGVEG